MRARWCTRRSPSSGVERAPRSDCCLPASPCCRSSVRLRSTEEFQARLGLERIEQLHELRGLEVLAHFDQLFDHINPSLEVLDVDAVGLGVGLACRRERLLRLSQKQAHVGFQLCILQAPAAQPFLNMPKSLGTEVLSHIPHRPFALNIDDGIEERRQRLDEACPEFLNGFPALG
jgi:hypothetical protein